MVNSSKNKFSKPMKNLSDFSQTIFGQTRQLSQHVSDSTTAFMRKGKANASDYYDAFTSVVRIGYTDSKNFSGEKVDQFLASKFYTTTLQLDTLKKTDRYLGHVLILPFGKYPQVFVVLISLQLIIKILIKLRADQTNPPSTSECVGSPEEITRQALENNHQTKPELIAQLKYQVSKIQLTDLLQVTELLLMLPITRKFRFVKQIKLMNALARKVVR